MEVALLGGANLGFSPRKMGLPVSPVQGRADLGSGLSSKQVGLPGLAQLGRDSPAGGAQALESRGCPLSSFVSGHALGSLRVLGGGIQRGKVGRKVACRA